MGLLVLEVLQPVLEPAQENIRRRQLLDRRGGELAFHGERPEHLQRRARPQLGVAPPANQLERLRDELDLADAPGAELDVVGEVAARHLLADLRVQLPDRLDRAVVEILPEHERPDDLSELLGQARLAAGDDARLDPRVAFPLAPMREEVLLERVEARRERPGVAPRPQPHVDPEDLPVRGRVGEEADHALPEPHEELVMRERPRTGGLAFLRIHEHEVDVGGDVELAPAELAHPDDQEVAGGRAVGRLERGARAGVGGGERNLGEVAHRRHDLGERREPGEVADGDAQEHPRPQLPERRREARIVREVAPGEELAHVRGAPGFHGRLIELARQRGPRLQEPAGEPRVGERGARRERGPGRFCGAGHGQGRETGRGRGRLQYNRSSDSRAARSCSWGLAHDSSLGVAAPRRQSMIPPHAASDSSPLPAAAVEAQLAPNERRWLHGLRWAGWALVTIYFLAVGGMLALRFWVLPGVAAYKAEIAAAVSRAVGARVELGGVEAEWFGLRPRLELTEVRIFDRRGDEALALPYVGVTIAWRSLVAGELRFRTVVLDRPDLSIRRDPQGRLFVAGLELPSGGDPDGSAADWLLKQGEIVIRDGTVEWSDEQRRAVPIRLERVDFVLQNEGRRHKFAFRAAPPSELASAIDLRGDLVGRTLTELREWNGRVYAGFDYIDLAAWQTWVDYPFQVDGGRGALRLWVGFANQRLTELSADLALADVATRLAPELPLLELASVLGQFGAKKVTRFELIDLDGEPDVAYEAFARQLALALQGGATLPPADFTARWEPAQGRRPARGEIVAPRLELTPLALVGKYLPLPEQAREALVAAAPEGRLSDVSFAWTGEVSKPATFAARGKFADLGMHPYRQAPGFSRLAGGFEANDRGGTVTVAANGVTIDYPGIFSEPTFAFDAVGARVSWSFPQGNLQVRLEEVTLSSPDLAGSLSGTYRTGSKGVRGIDITARLTRAEGRHVYRYIPALPSRVVDWLREGIQSGDVGETRVRLRGDLDDFPFRDATKGEFRISGRVTGGTLQYADGWPKLTNITADLVFDGPRLKISSPRANALGTQISDAVVTLPDLYGDHTDVLVSGEAQGPTGEFLKFIAQSPVSEVLDGLTDGWTAEGRGRLNLNLELPLEHMERAKVAGTFQFAANGLQMGSGQPPLTQLTGRVDFTESGVSARNLTAVTLGGSISAQLTTRDGAVTAVVQGNADAAQLTRSVGLPIADRVRGLMPFKYTTSSSRQRPSSSTFESSLVGVAVDLPPPFGKAAADSMPLRVESSPLAAKAAGGGHREELAVSAGSLLSAKAELWREGEHTVIERGGVAIGGVPLKLPDRPGVLVAGKLEALDLDRLLPLVTSAAERTGGAELSVNALDFEAGTLVVNRRQFHDVKVHAQFDGRRTWRADVSARELAGELAWRPEGQGALAARLKYLIHPQALPGATPGDETVKRSAGAADHRRQLHVQRPRARTARGARGERAGRLAASPTRARRTRRRLECERTVAAPPPGRRADRARRQGGRQGRRDVSRAVRPAGRRGERNGDARGRRALERTSAPDRLRLAQRPPRAQGGEGPVHEGGPWRRPAPRRAVPAVAAAADHARLPRHLQRRIRVRLDRGLGEDRQRRGGHRRHGDGGAGGKRRDHGAGRPRQGNAGSHGARRAHHRRQHRGCRRRRAPQPDHRCGRVARAAAAQGSARTDARIRVPHHRQLDRTEGDPGARAEHPGRRERGGRRGRRRERGRRQEVNPGECGAT